MKPDTGWMKSQFVAFNRRYFQTRLPLPQFRVSNARTFLGNMRWREDRIRHKYYDFKLTMSVYYDLEEKELQNVMLHEMIHYYIAYHHLKDTSPHGGSFAASWTNSTPAVGTSASLTATPPPTKRLPKLLHRDAGSSVCFSSETKSSMQLSIQDTWERLSTD